MLIDPSVFGPDRRCPYDCVIWFHFLLVISGNLMPGDQILEVNGDSLIGVTSERWSIYGFRLLFKRP